MVARHGAANRLGAAVQLCSLPWLGFVPDDVVSAPPVAVARLSERLRIPVGELVDYGSREQTRTDHLREVARYLGWRLAEEFQWCQAGVRRGDKWRGFAKLNGGVHATPEGICAGH